jgi:hypothetical protein
MTYHRKRVLRSIVLVFLILGSTYLNLANNPIPLPKQSDADDFLQTKKLTTLEVRSKLGRTVAISSNGLTVLSGADENENGTKKGFAVVFRGNTNDNSWTQTRLTAPDGAGDDEFGVAVALSEDGNTALVGAWNANVGGISNSGAAYVFTFNGTNWIFNQKLFAATPETNAGLGRSVALSPDGNTAFIGGLTANGDTGAVYVFERTGATWQETQKLTGMGTNDEFGTSIAFSGGTLMIGAAQPEVGNGAVYVFTKSGVSWQEQQKLTASDGLAADQFGRSVTLNADGTKALIGASLGDTSGVVDSGSVYFWSKVNGSWIQQQELAPGGGVSGQEFGFSVDLNAAGNVAVIGSRNRTGNGTAYIFKQNGNQWSQEQRIQPDGSSTGDWFGVSAVLNATATHAVIGSTGAEGQSGVAFVFTDLPFQNCGNVIGISQSECNALVSLYDSTDGGGWVDQTLWKANNAPCTWEGVICQDIPFDSKIVTRLELQNNGLNGTVNSSITGLTNLQYLNLNGSNALSSRKLSGNLPSQIGSMLTLRELYLANNAFSGGIPTSFGNLAQLERLNLNDNQLDGSLPVQLGNLTNLKQLNASSNKLSGAIPTSFENLTALTDFTINSNNIIGDFPPGMIDINMTELNIRYNGITAGSSAVKAYLDGEAPGWEQTQTITPPDANYVPDIAKGTLTFSWTPIAYQGDGGNYAVTCESPSLQTQVELTTLNKTVSEVIFSGLPTGMYTCTVKTTTPPHRNNDNEVVSEPKTLTVDFTNNSDVPFNDLFTNPAPLNNIGVPVLSYNIKNATDTNDPIRPTNFAGCNIAQSAEGIHYQVSGAAIGNGQEVVVRAGGPAWYRRQNSAAVVDTAIVLYEKNNLNAPLACADDNSLGQITLSNLKFTIDASKTYQLVVWNEADAPEGAEIEIARATFNLNQPQDAAVFPIGSPPTTFQWDAYKGQQVISYAFKVSRTTADPIEVREFPELTPASDGDVLTCNASTCTMNAAFINDFLIGGHYLWSVSAITEGGSNTNVFYSNQIFHFTMGDLITPTPDGNTPTATPTNQPTTGEFIFNGGFEEDSNGDGEPEDWKMKNSTKDKLKCNKPGKLIAYSGDCAFMFKGVAGENSRLQQTVNFAGVTFSTGDSLLLSLYYNAKVDGQVKVKVKSTDGANIGGTTFTMGESDGYAYTERTIALSSTSVDKAKVQFVFRSVSKKLFVDEVSLTIKPSASLLPLP